MFISYKKYTDEDYEFVYNLKKEAYKDYVIKYYGEYNEEEQIINFNNHYDYFYKVNDLYSIYHFSIRDRNYDYYN